jgi:hypothetical protein
MTEPSIQMFDARTIESLSWPNTEEAEQAKRFLLPLIRNGVNSYIDNLQTTLAVLLVDNIVLPLTINDAEYDNSYVCSPYGHYIGHAEEVVGRMEKPYLRWPVQKLLRVFGKFLQFAKINKVVVVNNWLLSTNLYSPLTSAQIAAIKIFLKKHFPHHALLFRSIDSYSNQELFDSLKTEQFDMVASRPIYFMDMNNSELFQSRMFKSDLKVLEQTLYHPVSHADIPLAEAERIAELYRSLYLDKYSPLSPHLNGRFIKLLLNSNFLSLQAFQKEGRIDAVCGFFCRGKILMSPLVGYNQDAPKENKLYRLISTYVTLEAKKRKMIYHLSSGAASYKKLRRATMEVEYTAVNRRHLPLRQQAGWNILRWVMNCIGVPIMQQLET